MTQSIFQRQANPGRFAVAAFTLLLLAACGSGDKGDSSPLTDTDGILGFVPSDTPYVFAAVESMPDAVLDKLEESSDGVLDAYKTVIGASLEQVTDDAETAEEEEQMRVALSLAEAFVDLLRSDNLRAAGIPRGAQMALYGVGVLPVIRIELSNPVAFQAKIAEIEASMGGNLETAGIDGQSYRFFPLDGAQMVIAVVDDYAVGAVTPESISDDMMAAVLGLEKPSDSIAESGALQAMAEAYEFSNYGLGFFSVARLVETFSGGAEGIDAELLALMDYSADDVSPVCRNDLRSAAAVMPRIVSGYTTVMASNVASNTVFEMRSDIAQGLPAISAPVPGLGADPGGLVSFGMSIDALALREFLEARFDAYEADPYTCEFFAGIQPMIDQARISMNQPVPPVAYSFKGFLGVIDRIEGLDFSGQQPPEVVEARFLIANDNAPALLAMGAMFSPEIAMLNLQPDGQPVALPLPQLAAMGTTSFVAMTQSALAISVGDGEPAGLTELLESPAAASQPSVSVRLDGQRYYEFMSEAVKAGNAADGNEEMSEELQEAASTVMAGIGDAIDRISVDVTLTSRGIELPANVTLQD